jgi:hypothetical protein
VLDWSVENITPDMTQYVIQLGVSAILILSVIIVCRDNYGKKSLKIPKGVIRIRISKQNRQYLVENRRHCF